MFEGIKNISEVFSKMGDIKATSEKMSQFMENLRVTGDAGAGMVQVVANGKGQFVDIKIDKALLNGDEIKMLEDLVLAAVNDANKKVKESMEHEYKKAMGMSPADMMNLFKGG
ncbi:MAG: YbaB/EbfC family nucleoid-associated protein, partial [Leptospira sp.]|nr:YbaB/EbfC family nucleoid-associated protein [Leptospira sp.]